MPEDRPAVDIVVPFRGTAAERDALLDRLEGLELRAGDTQTVVDNGPEAPAGLGADPRLIHAPAIPTSYHARNRGAQRGAAEWILFIDADVEPPTDLLDRYFAPAPGERVGVLGGGVRDEIPDDLDRVPLAARYAALRQPMAHDNTLRNLGDRWSYAQTANAMVRRAAFEAVGGFTETIRSGGDADLCFRLRGAGWGIETRAGAAVVHRNRTTLRALARQRARHGAGAAWLNRTYPGAFPGRLRPGSAVFVARRLAQGWAAAARGDRDTTAVAITEAVSTVAYEFGRFISNEPAPRRT